MKAILHIGMPKTGSTAIQSWLDANKSGLARQGVAYDRLAADGFSYETAHVEMAICVFARMGVLFKNRSARAAFGLHDLEAQARFAKTYEAQLVKALSQVKQDVIVLSSEYFAANLKTSSAVETARDWLLEIFDDVDVLLYFRRQEDIVPSSYAQRLRSGADVDIEEVLNKVATLNYKRIARRWKLVMGKGRLRVQLLESDELVGGTLISDFAHVLGVDATGFSNPRKVNTSCSAAALRTLRDFNATHPAFLEDGSRNPEAFEFKKLLWKADAELEGARLQLSAEQYARIRAACSETNASLRKTFFAHRTELFPEKDRKAGPSAQDIDQQTQDLRAKLDDLRSTYRTPVTGSLRRLWDKVTDQPSI